MPCQLLNANLLRHQALWQITYLSLLAQQQVKNVCGMEYS